jgi:hypothetical protein
MKDVDWKAPVLLHAFLGARLHIVALVVALSDFPRVVDFGLHVLEVPVHHKRVWRNLWNWISAMRHTKSAIAKEPVVGSCKLAIAGAGLAKVVGLLDDPASVGEIHHSQRIHSCTQRMASGSDL